MAKLEIIVNEIQKIVVKYFTTWSNQPLLSLQNGYN